jgi:hypothetical protein
MKTSTFTPAPIAHMPSHFIVGVVTKGEIYLSFSTVDYLTNIATTKMSAEEARKLASQLIVYADKIDPQG